MTLASSATTPISRAELETTPHEVKRYQRQKLTAMALSLALSLAFLGLMGLWAGPRVDELVRGWVGPGPWLRLIVLAILYGVGLEVLTLPLNFWSKYVLEHRYHLSNQTFGGWVWRQFKGYLVGGPIGLVLLLGLYFLLRQTGWAWWLWATAGWLLVTLALGRLLPVVILPLFYEVTRLDDASLLERLRRLSDGTGLAVEGVYRLHLSAETRKANAALAGLGRTRRVLLGDTLLQQFTPEEIEVVFAHEVGHHVHRHLAKMIVWSVFLAAAGFWLVDWVLRTLGETLGYPHDLLPVHADPATLPLLLFILSVFGLLLSPLQNALSRFFESQCDRYALDRTGVPDAYRSAFVKLARINKADPDPNPVVVCLFYDHPPIRQRLAMAGVPPHPGLSAAGEGVG
jgi:STE24 endopeptidase